MLVKKSLNSCNFSKNAPTISQSDIKAGLREYASKKAQKECLMHVVQRELFMELHLGNVLLMLLSRDSTSYDEANNETAFEQLKTMRKKIRK